MTIKLYYWLHWSTAEHFFHRLRSGGVKKVIDVRLWATQTSGFAKKDLPYFLKELSGIDYEYRDELAPTDDILKAYKQTYYGATMKFNMLI